MDANPASQALTQKVRFPSDTLSPSFILPLLPPLAPVST